MITLRRLAKAGLLLAGMKERVNIYKQIQEVARRDFIFNLCISYIFDQ
jgi:hypothetical protein